MHTAAGRRCTYFGVLGSASLFSTLPTGFSLTQITFFMKKLIVFFVFLFTTSTLISQTLQPNWWAADQTVNTIVKDGNTVYIGGNFNVVGPVAPFGVPIDPATGKTVANFPKPNSEITAAVSDGSGGWIIAGQFNIVGGVNRSYLAHINSSGQVTNRFQNLITPSYTGTIVTALVSDGNGGLYIGGNFTTSSPFRRNILHLDANDQISNQFNNANLDGGVTDIKVDGNQVYVIGNFYQAGPDVRNVATLSKTNGALIAGFPQTNGTVRAVVPDGNGGWFVGGQFQVIGGISRQNLAHVNASNQVTSLFENLEFNGVGIYALEPDGAGGIYVGGNFNAFNSKNRFGLAHFDGSGNLTNIFENSTITGDVNSIKNLSGVLYAGGNFTEVGNGAQFGIPVNTTTGVPDLTFKRPTDGPVFKSIPDGSGGWYIGGSFRNIDGFPRSGLAHLNASGQVTPLFANTQITPFGRVQDMELSAGILYVGGQFTYVGKDIKFGTRIDGTTGVAIPTAAIPNGSVEGAIPDGNGGWYIWGGFNKINTQNRQQIARINADGSLHPWNPSLTGSPRCAATAGGKLYIGLNASIVCFDIATGNPLPLNIITNSEVNRMLVHGNTLFFAGPFTQVNGQSRTYIAAMDLVSESLLGFSVQVDNSILGMAAINNTLYLGGGFTNIGGQTRNRLAAVDAATGALQSWDPNSNAFIRTMSTDGTFIYAGGDFTTIGATSKNRLCQLDAVTGLATAADYSINDGTVVTVVNEGGLLYVGGSFSSAGGQERSGFSVLNPTTGLANALNPSFSEQVSTISMSGGQLYTGGTFTRVNGFRRRNLMAIEIATGTITSWNPNANSDVKTLVIDGTEIFAGGNFTQIGGQSRNGIAKINLSTGVVDASWNPNLNGTVATAEVSAGVLYMGGSFSNVSGTTRNNAAAVSTTSGALTIWNPNVNNSVNTLAISGSTVYLGGNFTQIGGTGRNFLGAVNNTTGAITTWNPGANSSVSSLAINGTTVYAGGDFTTLGGATRLRLGAVPTSSNTATAWNPSSYWGSVISFAFSGSSVYVGGNFYNIGGVTARNNAAAINTSTGLITSWNANVNGTVNAVAASGTTIYLGGSFTTIGGTTRNRIGAVNNTTGAITTWNPNANNEVHSLAISGTTIYAGGSFTNIGGQSRNRLAALNNTTGAATATSWLTLSSTQPIYALAVDGTTLYIGAQGTIDLTTENIGYGIAALSTSGGGISGWMGATNSIGSVRTIGIAPGNIVIGGNFFSAGGTSRNQFLRFNNSTSQFDNFRPTPFISTPTTMAVDGSRVYLGGNGITAYDKNTGSSVWNVSAFVNRLLLDGNTLYAGGSFTTINSTVRNYAAALNATNGTVLSWNPNPETTVTGLAKLGTKIYLSGNFRNVGGSKRSFIAVVDHITGALDPQELDANSTVSNLVTDGSKIFAMGNFQLIGGRTRTGLAAIDATTGEATNWNPGNIATPFTIRVNTIALGVNNVYIGGSFSNLGGQTRTNIAAISKSTGLATSWNPAANSEVTSLVLTNGKVYAGGFFTNIGGQSRNFLAAVDESTGLATAWNPAPNNVIRTMAKDNTSLYVGGNFTNIGAQSRLRIAAYDLTTEAILAWNPGASNEVNTIEASTSVVYVGGAFTIIGGFARNFVAAINKTTGVATDWNPNAGSRVNAILPINDKVYLGGQFFSIGGTSISNLASVDISTGALSTWRPNTNARVYSLAEGSLLVGGDFFYVTDEIRPSFAAFILPTSLPVTLTQFNARRSGSQGLLTWTTASEENNKGFYVQRSSNGQAFTNLGFVAAKGNGSGASYSFTDAVPLSGRNFYRLQQVDEDGKSSFSPVRELSFGKQGLRIYPNPVQQTLTLTMSAGNEPLRLRLTDLSGRVVKTWSYAQTPALLQLVVADLPQGTYFLEAEQDTREKQTLQVLKQ